MKLIKKKKKTDGNVTEKSKLSPWKVLVVDDEPDIHTVTRMAFEGVEFEGKSLQTLHAMSSVEAQEILKKEADIALALIDIVMETDDAGLKLVDFIRNEMNNSLIRLIIRTGQPGAAPEKEVVERYDINDYKDKTELTNKKLYTTIRLALKSYSDLNTLNTSNQGLQSILEIAKDLYQPQQLDNHIYDLVLSQIIDLCNLSSSNSFINSGMIVTSSEEGVKVQTRIGKIAALNKNTDMQTCLEGIFKKNGNTSIPSNMTLIPFEKNEERTSFICLENAQYLSQVELNLIHIMANECAIARQLAAANKKIVTLNEYLKADNVRMRAELDVTRQLQQMVLPTETELKNIADLDIAAFMEPAEEVGGDYYDVLQYDDRILCGIGGVTGHGLESGVLTLMVQTAVRCLLESGIQDATQFLNILNRTIYKNVQRMNIDKNLTLSFLDYQTLPSSQTEVKGVLQLTGQHEEILIARHGGKVERIDTLDLGFPVGWVADITNFVSQRKVQLQSGDVVVLYTDGITEAFNADKIQYGIERLCEVISHHWQCSAEEIKKAIITDVQKHIGEQKVFDDITLLVIKQKNIASNKQ
ncbi:SpoIIE family protein phosphatase [Candidatus Parabeggiatoa sp. HSG14]|uniref:SpoIIE family protein phosphatase n=1 Tax=Candidatus Parabeggiatoa sp. HSG14 TaxID=3055593 RepID=UPI0025A89312|nr:SpoIIE family protein phosphatase [Thiotrichales bacterium HSG14]